MHAKCTSSIIGILREGKKQQQCNNAMATRLVTFLLPSDESWCTGSELVSNQRVVHVSQVHRDAHRTASYRIGLTPQSEQSCH